MKIDDRFLVFLCAISFILMAFFGFFGTSREKKIISQVSQDYFTGYEKRQDVRYQAFVSNVIQVISLAVSNGVFGVSGGGKNAGAGSSTFRPDITVGWVNGRAFAWVNGRICSEGDYIADGVIRRICPDGIVLDTGAVLSIVGGREKVSAKDDSKGVDDGNAFN